MEYYGIDVSHWQGNIDWDKVKNCGIAFAILKLSQGSTYKDSEFEVNYAGAISRMPVGCYIYNKVKTVAQAQAEAKYAVKILAGRPMPCGVWLDMEDASMRKLGKNVLTSIIDAEANILKAAGYSVGIYCNKDWYYNVLAGSELAKKYPFWIARYPSSDNGTIKESLSPKAYAKIWQYSSKGKVPGIKGNVDRNLAYVDVVELMQGSRNTAQQSTVETLKEAINNVFFPKYTGKSASIVEALASLGISSSYSYRKKIAKVNSITAYMGTPKQNTTMLKLLKSGSLIRP